MSSVIVVNTGDAENEPIVATLLEDIPGGRDSK